MGSALQRRIFRCAPRFHDVHLPSPDGEGPPRVKLIPDTPKARQRALEDGATHFDTLSFLRREESWASPRMLFGAFYCHLMVTEGVAAERLFADIAALIPDISPQGFLLRDVVSISFTHLRLDGITIGMAIPARAFGMEGGSPVLSEFYEAVAEEFQRQFSVRGAGYLRVVYRPLTEVRNQKLPLEQYAIPLTFQEFVACSPKQLRITAAQPRRIPDIPSQGCMRNEALRRDLIREAESRYRRRMTMTAAKRKVVVRPWLQPMPLIDANGQSACPGATMDGLKCAIKLQTWIRQQGITEFRCRNASQAVSGTFTLDNGLDEALDILSRHGFIRECEPFVYNSRGRRSGPWQVLNPMVLQGG